ncbi:MAG: hypothetical protein A2046_12320 [Bacteroidetes bacterium GWA2_30_7]|nr:MAG: hypothetical protein A2046_12320 [Bacteroidetes bacterium GWA2_30_7]
MNKTYLQQRLSELNITPEQNEISVFDSVEGIFYKSEFFKSDKDDNIRINYLDPSCNVEKCEKKGKLQDFSRTRLKEPNGQGKYTQPFNSSVIPFVTPSIIKKVKMKTVIDTLFITEGEFKAFSGSINGIDTIGISGIYNFKNKGENKLHEYFHTIIETCQVKNIVLLFDADCMAIKFDETKDLYIRLNQFYAAVAKFKELTKTLNVDVYFSHIKTSLNDTAKGLDDLINHADTDINILKSELYNLTVSNENRQYIDCISISANSILKLREYFGLDNVDEFYTKYVDAIGANDFIFHGKTYEIIEGKPLFKTSNDIKFWYVVTGGTIEKRKYTLHIDRVNFAKFLQSKGFYRIYVGKYPMLIRIENNIVDEVTAHLIRDFIKDYVRSLPNIIESVEKEFSKTDLESCLINANHIYFSDINLNWIDAIELKTKRDTQNEAFIYFKNCFVKITKEDIETFDYSTLEKPIWRKQIIERFFDETVIPDSCEIKQFILNVCNKNEARYNALLTAIGYLLYQYKDPANTKLIVFVDEKISNKDEANGGSGKSLVAACLRHFKSVCYKGKGWNPKERFAFEGVNLDTDILLIDDALRNFDYESLFTKITNDFEVEGKNDKSFTIPFEVSPKFILTTNYTLKGEGNSYLRRKAVYEFSDHYNENNTPKKEFTHRLFDDWDVNQWSQFDLFMLTALQYYLDNGLKEVAVNYAERNLIETVSESFIDFMATVKRDQEHLTNDLLEKFIEFDKYYKDKIKPTMFNKWLKKYVKCKGIKTEGSQKINNKEAPLTKDNGKIYIKLFSN